MNHVNKSYLRFNLSAWKEGESRTFEAVGDPMFQSKVLGAVARGSTVGIETDITWHGTGKATLTVTKNPRYTVVVQQQKASAQHMRASLPKPTTTKKGHAGSTESVRRHFWRSVFVKAVDTRTELTLAKQIADNALELYDNTFKGQTAVESLRQ